MKARFSVGEDENLDVEVFCSSWSGMQIYTVNGEVVRKFRSFKPNDVVEFTIGRRSEYDVKVVLKSFPTLSSEVYINGDLYVETLFNFSDFDVKGNKYRDTSCIKSVITFIFISIAVGFLGRIFFHYTGNDIPEFFGVFVVFIGAVFTHYLFKTAKFSWFSCRREK